MTIIANVKKIPQKFATFAFVFLLKPSIMKLNKTFLPLFAAGLVAGDAIAADNSASGNPIFEGWYADPHAVVYDGTYWVYPTNSLNYEEQISMDCFSSPDLVNWQKHEAIIDTCAVKWAKKCMWAPAPIQKDGKYYLFFGANDVHEGEVGGIGVGVADSPQGPFKDLLGRPLINEIVNGAQPIDQFVFEEDGNYYMYYGGWGHCNVVRLSPDFTSLLPWDDGQIFKEITPDPNYVEGSFLIKRNGQYIFMWSEGAWTLGNYCVAYGVADSLTGPFERKATILQTDPQVGTGAGHHSVVNIPGSDKWLIFYHRHPLNDNVGNHRVVCVEEMKFKAPDSNEIIPVKLTDEGVKPVKLKD